MIATQDILDKVFNGFLMASRTLVPLPASGNFHKAPVLLAAILVGGMSISSVADREDEWSGSAGNFGAGRGLAGHPVNVRPSSAVAIPKGWPLSANGSITCQTCHYASPSAQGRADPKLRGGFDGLEADSSRFCLKCHSEGNDRSAASAHWMAVQLAHPKAETDRASFGGGSPDTESRRCLMCHDGVSASEARNPTAWNRGGGNIGDPRRNHPVGVRYPSGLRRGASSSFRPVSTLPRHIRLPGGMVSCVSCHDLYARTPSLLTVPIEGSALCFSCHQM